MKNFASEKASLYSPAVAELVAIGAAIAANCEPCFKYHFAKAKKLGICPRDMARAVAMAQAVKEAPARSILGLAERTLEFATAPMVLRAADQALYRAKQGGRNCVRR